MADWQWFTKAHRAVYKATNGRIGGNLLGIRMVLMHTVGAKTGQLRSAPVACYPHPDGLLVIASNNGGPKAPAWWYNLKAHPEIEIQYGREKRLVHAEEISEEERLKYWDGMAKTNPRINHYWQQSLEEYGRRIPVVLLKTLKIL